MALALRINASLENRGMYLCVFIIREHYRDQGPSHIKTVMIVLRHTEPLKEAPTRRHSGLLHKNAHKRTGLWIRWRFPSTLLKYAVKYFCNTLSP